MKLLPFTNTAVFVNGTGRIESACIWWQFLQPFHTVKRLLIKGSISKSLKVLLYLTQILLNLLAGVLNLARSAGPELLLKDDASKPLLEKLLKGWLLEKSIGSVCSIFEVCFSNLLEEDCEEVDVAPSLKKK